MGSNIYINHDMIILDCNEVRIGNDVYIGPRVGLYAANHAEDPIERINGGVYSKPITIGNKVWLCGDVKVAPGVTIGENTIIGTGSVVVKDIPANVVAAGNPCKVIRPIRENENKWTK
jgi:maltose O-acetyltransferase